ncbi:hypothetical protein PAMP_000811 [Pampus punctatissimus]
MSGGGDTAQAASSRTSVHLYHIANNLGRIGSADLSLNGDDSEDEEGKVSKKKKKNKKRREKTRGRPNG